jgi:hypothetical protein
MFEDFNSNALEFGEIDENFMEEWHIELDEDESNWRRGMTRLRTTTKNSSIC